MAPWLRSAIVGAGFGAVVAAGFAVFLYQRGDFHFLPELLCISSNEKAPGDDTPETGQSKGVLEWSVRPGNGRLEKEALIELKDSGGIPVSDAEIEVSFDMPSMPMMHAIPKITAQPTGQAGQYRVLFKVDMAGAWVAKFEMKRPIVFKTTRKFFVE